MVSLTKENEYKFIPAIVALTAGLVISIVTIVNKVSALRSLILIFAFLLGFYVLGSVFRFVLLAVRTKEKPEEEGEDDSETVDVQTKSDENAE